MNDLLVKPKNDSDSVVKIQKELHGRIFTRLQIVAGGALGSIMAGFLMLVWNFYRLNEKRKAVVLMLVSIPLTVTTLFMASVIPRTNFDRLWPMISAIVVYVIASLTQGNVFRSLANSPENQQRAWMFVGFTVLGLITSLIFLSVMILLNIVD